MFGYGCCNILVKCKVVKANFYGIDSLVQMSRKSSKQKSHNPDDKHQSSRDIGNYGSQCTNDTVVEDVLRLPETLKPVSPAFRLSIDTDVCPVCDSAQEEVAHVFFCCSLARDLTRLICRWWNLDEHLFSSYAEWLSWFNSLRLGSKLKAILEGVFYITWWSVWNFRNHLLFASTKPRKESIFGGGRCAQATR
ncbi:hypothetical protein Tco_1117357, partial [Tanacetum coccineum]